jgi:hypothetical protein
MPPDSFETDRLAAEADASGPLDIMTDASQPSARPRAMRSLFQIVCLQGAPATQPGTTPTP